MRDALKSAGRPIVFSLCEWGSNKPWLWATDVGNLWRTTGDISDCWDCKKGQLSLVQIADLQVGLETYAGPGHWNDPDMLEVGNGGMTTTEYRSHFGLWCILAAPLMAGNDLKNMSPEIKEILTNKEVIAIDRDPLGMQGRRLRKNGDTEVWAKQLKEGGRAVVLFNRGASDVGGPKGELMPELHCDLLQDLDGVRDDFGSDAVSRENCNSGLHDFNIPAFRA